MSGHPPYDELAAKIVAELRGIGHAVSPLVVNELRGEKAVLQELSRADGPLSPGALSASAHVSSARVANILRSLEEKGLVVRQHSERDRRSVEVSVTDAGLARAQAHRDEALRHLAALLGELGEDDAAELARILARLRVVVEGRVEGCTDAASSGKGCADATGSGKGAVR